MSNKQGKTLALVPAGGSGARMGAEKRKQYLPVQGVPILVRTLRALQEAGAIDEIYLAVPAEDIPPVRNLLTDDYAIAKLSLILEGGAHRQDSVWNGLKAARREHEVVLIHDAVRPFASPDLICRVAEAARAGQAALAAVPVKDTIKAEDGGGALFTLAREGLWIAQTPQAFPWEMIWKGHEQARQKGLHATDDAALVEAMGIPVRIVPGSYDNIKITTPEDILYGEFLLAVRPVNP